MKDLSREIKAWIEHQPGWFASWQLDEALKITTKRDKDLRRQITKRMCDNNILIRAPSPSGIFFYNERVKLKRLK